MNIKHLCCLAGVALTAQAQVPVDPYVVQPLVDATQQFYLSQNPSPYVMPGNLPNVICTVEPGGKSTGGPYRVQVKFEADLTFYQVSLLGPGHKNVQPKAPDGETAYWHGGFWWLFQSRPDWVPPRDATHD